MNRLTTGTMLSLLAVTAMIATAQAQSSRPVVERLWGNTKFETNVEVLRSSYPNGTDELVVVTGDNYPDALSSLNLEGALLLVPSCGELPAATDDLLDLWEAPTPCSRPRRPPMRSARTCSTRSFHAGARSR